MIAPDPDRRTDPDLWTLRRYPPTKDRSLRAFDAADQLALAEVAGRVESGIRALVVNDSFGGLAVPLAAAGVDVTVWTDSVLSEIGIRKNLELNGLDEVQIVPSTTTPSGTFDVLVVKVPKTLAFLEEQLSRVRPCIDDSTMLVGAGMVKHIHTSTLEIFGKVIGPTVTSLAKKKARLILPTFDPAIELPAPAPTRYLTESGVECVNLANVFSHGKLDIGTRLLLDHLPKPADGCHVVDLGCGNGVLGTSLAQTYAGGSVTFCDISHAAIASAGATWDANLGGDHRAQFHAGDLAPHVADASVDYVVINPPFHDQHVVGDETAGRMFVEARRVLRDGGEVRVIGNRHLGYHKRLRSIFGNLETIASNAKFVVLSSQKQAR